MIHIILTILKIIGILLLVILGIILTLILLVLFVPIRYRFHAGINEQSALNLLLERAPLISDDEKPDLLENLELTGSVTWLLRLVRVVIHFAKKKLDYKVSIAFFDILSSKLKEKRKRRRRRGKTARKDNPVPEATAENTDTTGIMTRQSVPYEEKTETPPATVAKEPEQPVEQAAGKTSGDEAKKVKKPAKDISGTMDELSNKAQNILDMALDTDNHALAIMMLQNLKKFLWHIRPRHYQAYLYYGGADPAVTGKVMMAYGMAKGILGLEHFEITPDFERKVIRLSAELEGRIRLIHIVVIGCKIYFNKTFRKLIGGKQNGR